MKVKTIIKNLFFAIIILLLSSLTIIFSALYVNTFNGGFFYDNKKLLVSIVVITVAVISVISLAYCYMSKKTIYKVTVVILSIISTCLLIMYFLKISGILDKIDSIEDLRNYVASFGSIAVFIYVLMNFLQVVLLPIPGFIAVGTGLLLFGPIKTSIYSLIGIVLGSLVAFFIGRILGYRVVRWIVGKESLDKWLKSVKNKDKIVLSFMFLFPFFPDDLLCFVAGLTTMSVPYYVVMILICRTISVVVSAFSLNGNIIPYTTWWGIVLWALVLAFTIVVTIFLYKYGDTVEKYFKQKFKPRRKKIENNSSRRP